MELLELVESIRAEEASVQRLFQGEGTGIRHGNLRQRQDYQQRLAEAAKFMADIVKGRRSMRQLQEAMTTSDFPYLFGDILDRQVLASYREAGATYRNYVKMSRVRDFRTVKRFSVYGADQILPGVKQKEEYPIDKMEENSPFTYSVSKFGRKLGLTWETFVNDDLDSLTDMPVRLGRAARRSEQKFVTQLHVDANGPHASFYTVGNKNIVTGNPALSIAGLTTALEKLTEQVDEKGEPIVIEMVELVVPPSLEVTAQNILNALQIEYTEKGGTSNQKITSANWMKNKFRLNVDHYIPLVASSANGKTSWFLFGNPDNGRPALELGHLIGHEEPEIFMKAPNSVRASGGSEEFDFDTDTREYKVRHVFGGSRLDPKMTQASNGSGS
ncbi:MAG: hypothetical protein CVU44_21020 [Chloroflexi bacterium HGW-Chloroflexi-6]|nr:MAG: hypothetical protein CVU44_21020 [Chloroflexi bacterium HGW-Chloroflexi-6]